jgi:hypothetical protein
LEEKAPISKNSKDKFIWDSNSGNYTVKQGYHLLLGKDNSPLSRYQME